MVTEAELTNAVVNEYWRPKDDAIKLMNKFREKIPSSEEFSEKQFLSHFPNIVYLAHDEHTQHVPPENPGPSPDRLSFVDIASTDDVWNWLLHGFRKAFIQRHKEVYGLPPLDNVIEGRLYNEKYHSGRTDVFNNSYSLLANRIVGSLELSKYERKIVKCTHGNGGTTAFHTSNANMLQPPEECSESSETPTKINLIHTNVKLYHEQINQLRDEKWLDDKILEKLRVDGILYNPSINRFLRFHFAMNQKAGGGWKNSYHFEQLRVDNLVTLQDRLYVSLHSLCTGYVMLILLEQRNWLKSRKELGRSNRSNLIAYFSSINMVLGSAIVILQITSSILRLIFFFNGERMSFSIIAKSQPKFTFSTLYNSITIIDTLVTAFAWIRITKYLEASQLVRFMSEVIERVSKRAIPYLIIFLSVIAAFNSFACVIFGPTSSNFSSWTRSFITLCQLVFDRIEMEEAEIFYPYIAPTFLFTYYLIVVLVMRNIFVAIFIDGYRAAAERYELRPPELVQWTCKLPTFP